MVVDFYKKTSPGRWRDSAAAALPSAAAAGMAAAEMVQKGQIIVLIFSKLYWIVCRTARSVGRTFSKSGHLPGEFYRSRTEKLNFESNMVEFVRFD